MPPCRCRSCASAMASRHGSTDRLLAYGLHVIEEYDLG